MLKLIQVRYFQNNWPYFYFSAKLIHILLMFCSFMYHFLFLAFHCWSTHWFPIFSIAIFLPELKRNSHGSNWKWWYIVQPCIMWKTDRLSRLALCHNNTLAFSIKICAERAWSKTSFGWSIEASESFEHCFSLMVLSFIFQMIYKWPPKMGSLNRLVCLE